ncbi:MAG: HEPN domain-containing protein [Candidatus Berkelbacteria bacterium Athens1014_28]|uniref:HEPN domain-containing protein n=1 Tax=Candidatus Berkelbacteria bacterium Athens1014_28 TaxID=2017145 RepID=A0A554LNW3_9BACT|nr:MAG: HEPN domain-containing protein [Candidatus Berkelbacteria bacterium Athens1014_28]
MRKHEIIKEMFLTAEKRLEIAEASIKLEGYADSVSRSYYAVFDIIRGMLELEKTVAKTQSGAIAKFSEIFIKTGKIDKKYSTLIKRMEKEREEADYKFKANINISDAKEAYNQAKEFVEEVKKYLEESE